MDSEITKPFTQTEPFQEGTVQPDLPALGSAVAFFLNALAQKRINPDEMRAAVEGIREGRMVVQDQFRQDRIRQRESEREGAKSEAANRKKKKGWL